MHRHVQDAHHFKHVLFGSTATSAELPSSHRIKTKAAPTVVVSTGYITVIGTRVGAQTHGCLRTHLCARPARILADFLLVLLACRTQGGKRQSQQEGEERA